MLKKIGTNFFFTILFVFVLQPTADASSTDKGHSRKNNGNFLNNCKIFLDSNNSEVSSSIFSTMTDGKRFLPSIPVILGYIHYPVWVLIPPQISDKDIVVRLKHALLDSVEVFVGDSAELLHYASCGLLEEKVEPAIQDVFPCFFIPKELTSKSFLIKIRTSDVCAVAVEVFKVSSFVKLVKLTNRLYGLYFGAILILALINFFLFISAKYTSSLWYVLYILTFAVFQAFASGLVELPFVFNNAMFLKNATPFFACLCLSFGSFFTHEFLKLQYKGLLLTIFSTTIKSFEVIGAVLAIIALFGYGTVSSVVISMVLPIFLVGSLIIGFARIKPLGRPAIFFTLAISVLAIGVITNVLRNFGIIPNSFLAAHGNLIGSIFEFIIIAVALADRVSSIEHEKNEAYVEAQHANQLATESQLKALQAQINPHFLFNTLNALAELVTIFPERAEKLVLSLSKFFRYTLTASEKEKVTLRDEIEIVRTYLMIEQIRFGNRLEYEIDVTGSLDDIFIIGLLLQPIVENSIKYGIAPLLNGGKITLKFAVTEKWITIKIHDSGPGFQSRQHSTGTSHGLYNVKERLRLGYGDNAKLTCLDQNGALVELVIPIKETHDV